MKHLLWLSLLVAGCHSAPSVVPTPLPKPVAEPRPIAVTPTVPAIPSTPLPTTAAIAALEQKLRQQAQVLEALISQNDALNARLAAHSAVPEPLVTPAEPPSTPIEPPPSPPIAAPSSPPPTTTVSVSMVEPSLSPNADGVIDLAVIEIAAAQREPANPFAVRTLPPEAIREITLHVGGVIGGPTPCAIINERLVQSGDIVESLAVERVESDAVFLRHGEHRMRLTVSDQSARVRLPL